ncbi:MAG: hypothetical protein YK1309IOTA_2160002 [Marine Group I thaumarchaeote]|nr:MAG: hypothetical protein YK1309IOTA_2160002 [Marine Group I thaumarchaeote]
MPESLRIKSRLYKMKIIGQKIEERGLVHNASQVEDKLQVTYSPMS